MSPTTAQLTSTRWRLTLVAVVVCLSIGIMLVKSVRLQVMLGPQLQHLAEQQYSRNKKVSASRGNIYDRLGRPLGISVPVWSVSAAPHEIEDPVQAAEYLEGVLDLPFHKLEQKLRKDRKFVWLKRRLSPDVAERVRQAQIPGIGLHRESKRFYPNRELAGQLLGFVSIDGDGQQGVERMFDDYLKGRTAVLSTLRDNHGGYVLLSQDMDLSLLEGDDVYVTIDARLQHVAEEALNAAVSKHQAAGGFALLMEPQTGAIVALANNPAFNPNRVGLSKARERKNQVLSTVFEPGSTFKIITFAAALDAQVIQPEDPIFCENGRYKMGKYTIRDTHKDGWISISDAFKHSSNIGTLKISHQLGEERFKEYLERFGFGEAPGLHMPEVHRGKLPGQKRWGKIRLGTMSYGYGVMVSALQLAAATSVVANGGYKVTPRLLERIESPDGNIVKKHSEQQGERILTESTTKKLTKIMKRVLEPGGTGVKARIPGIESAGKTGTAEKIDPVTKRYSKEVHLSSFVGFAPADDPKYVAVVVIDEPKDVAFGGSTAGPVWRDLMSAALIQDGILTGIEAPSKEKKGSAVKERAPSSKPTELYSKLRLDESTTIQFLGLTAREAMKKAEEKNIDVRFSGVGTVVHQTLRSSGGMADRHLVHLQLGDQR